MKKKVLMLGLLSLALIDAHAAGNSWSLDSLRAKAISNNKATPYGRTEKGSSFLHP